MFYSLIDYVLLLGQPLKQQNIFTSFLFAILVIHCGSRTQRKIPKTGYELYPPSSLVLMLNIFIKTRYLFAGLACFVYVLCIALHLFCPTYRL